jgi:hypothetical protein
MEDGPAECVEGLPHARTTELKAFRLTLSGHEKEQQSQFDKTILQLSSGSLALSIAFIRDIAGPTAENDHFAGWGFACLIVSIFLTLGSFLVSCHFISKAIDDVDERLRTSIDPDGQRRTGQVIAWMNRTSYFSFVVGISFISAFAVLNLDDANPSLPIEPENREMVEDDTENFGAPHAAPPRDVEPAPYNTRVAPDLIERGQQPPPVPPKTPPAPPKEK